MGEGTLDLSAYKIVGLNPVRVEEVAPPKCKFERYAILCAEYFPR